jgi:hypothetical protein
METPSFSVVVVFVMGFFFTLIFSDLVVEVTASYRFPASNERGQVSREEDKAPPWDLGGSTADSCKGLLDQGTGEHGNNKDGHFTSKAAKALHFVSAKCSSSQQSTK